MATTYTTNYDLGKQENHADKFDMDVITDNADKIDAALTGLQSGIDGKQAALTTEQLAAVNSGITDADVAQIGLNKNNILYNIKDGVQNIFKLAAGTRIAGGVTFTINADGTITLSNTATSDAVFIISETLNVSDDTYVLYGDGFISGVFMDTYETGYTNRRTFTSSVVTNSNTKIWRLIVNSGTNVNGVTIRPMLCKNSLFDANPTYQPYALPNTAITPALQECVDNGVKNKVHVDNSGIFTASGSARSYDIPINVTGDIAISFGSLISTDKDSDSCAIVFLNSTNVGFLTISMNRGNNVSEIVKLTDIATKVRLYPASSYNESSGDTVTWNNLMICDESLWKVSQNYQPPAMTNAELTEITNNFNNVKSVITNTNTTFTPDTNCHYLVLIQASTSSALYAVYKTSAINIAKITGTMTSDSVTESGGVVTIATTAWSMISIIKIGKSSN